MKPTFEKSQPNTAGPLITLDEFGSTYQDFNAPECPIKDK